MTERRYVTVTALTKYIKRKFDVDKHLRDIWLKGELSNVKLHSRGHLYFTLKDEQARIQAVMFSTHNKGLAFKPEEGMKVLVRGEISLYEPSGTYQVYAKEMQADGIGNLYLAYEELKKRLELEGLFSQAHKQPIPKFPRTIGVITSQTGAAIRDIVTTIKRRYPIAKIILIPAIVQGEYAPSSIVNAISQGNKLGTLDVMIVGRGGGSIEELWAFNEEVVAREIYKSKVPIISAVGHETDYTIADFVADLRAPTPTGAAELAVPHIADLQERLLQRKTRLLRSMREQMHTYEHQLAKLQRSYAFRYPEQLLRQKEEQLDRMMEQFDKSQTRLLQQKQEKLQQIFKTLNRYHPHAQYENATQAHQSLEKTLIKEMTTILKGANTAFANQLGKLNAVSPLAVMERGYSVVYNEKEQLIKSVNQVKEHDMISVQVADGSIACQVKGVDRKNVSK
ncbi:exodeoxyribonuclease VII large subunit [Bacillus sp. HMF5848]|uniref:exodeoxyribonuclease VII large subunit n=1 Tax=Bacillus sp. HMF5848 TaxID=2495421 RepID=UPI000F767C7A|nr:exodeoxyribonuclease VII large subunit [Bacillus sp. HMF5848]RSK27793.1 exodeoxyribonuclease VII large subunit [Bacillus sp. HMF5848]